MIEYVFAPELRRWDVEIYEDKLIKHPVFVTVMPGGRYQMSIQRGLRGIARVEAVALQFGRIALGHDFQRSGYKDERRNRREWLQAEVWAAKKLIPEASMRMARRCGLDPWELAREVGVSERLVVVRYNTWAHRRGQILHLLTSRLPHTEEALRKAGAPFFVDFTE